MKKKIFIGIAAVLITVILLGLLQTLVMPKYISNPEGALIEEYYSNKGDHDVIFVGDCEVYESFVPSVMWEEYGVTSYIRGSAQQLAWQSYYLLEETLKYEEPKVVVFNVLALKYGSPDDPALGRVDANTGKYEDAFNRMTLDGMRWSTQKIGAINASMTAEENFIDYLFPLLRYHSRITELESDDLKYMFADPDYISDNGYLIKTGVRPMTSANNEGRPLLDYELPEGAMKYLDKMRDLCAKKGVELVLIKAPTNSWGYWWYDEWEEQIVKYAAENGLAYYNFIPLCDEMGIDWSTDTYDEGMHLNVYGAEKLTRYFGQILVDDHGVQSRKDDAKIAEEWNEHLRLYKEEKKRLEESEK